MKSVGTIVRRVGVAYLGALLAFTTGAIAQQPYQPAAPAQSPLQPLSPDQLDSLVAPIALYPDALLSQVLVASTYPLELVEAGQWLQQNRNLQGQQLMQAAQQQNWDPSIQALVAFPDVIDRLNSNIHWTTDLGNAFLAQQADVMNAVQRLRAEAQSAGKLTSNTEETVATDTQDGRTVVEIQPTNPQVVYVPAYNPVDVWGPPDYGYYPDLYYPDYGWGFGFSPGIYIGGFFGGLGWGGWGWGPNWFNCSVWLNGGFFNHYGFHDFDGRWGRGGWGDGFAGRGGWAGGGWGGGFAGRENWVHNPEHRLGVAYPNATLANRFGGSYAARGVVAGRGVAGGQFGGNFPARGATVGRGFSGASQFGGNQPGGNFPARGATAGRGFGGGSQFGGNQPGGNFPARGATAGRGVGGNFPAAGSTAGRGFSGGRFGGNFGTSGPTVNRGFAGSNNFSSRGPNTAPGAVARSGQIGPSRNFNSLSPPNYRTGPAYGGSNAYRPAPSYGGSAYGGFRTMPAYRTNPSPSYRSSPSYGGGFNSARAMPAYRSTPSFSRGFNSGNFRSAPSFSAPTGGSRGFSGGGGYHGFSGGSSFRGFSGGGGGGSSFRGFSGGGGGGSSFHGGGGGSSFHGGGGGGASFHGGGGSSGGGSHGGRR